MNPFEMVAEFHKATGQAVRTDPNGYAEALLTDEDYLRKELIEEEYTEFLDAWYESDIVAIADALADLIYVCIGAAHTYGIPLEEVFAEVHRSNMTKTKDGTIRDDGKFLKGPSYEPPRILEILRERGYPGD